MKHFSILLLIVMIFACETKDTKRKSFLVKDPNKIDTKNITFQKEDISFGSIFTQVSEVVLITDDKHFITNISEIVVSNKNFVVADRRGKQLLVFDRKGKLANSIGIVGSGPGEFKSVESIDVNKKNEILLLDNRGRVSKFKFDGEFLRSYSISRGASFILADSNSGFYLYSPISGIKPLEEDLINHYNEEGQNDFSFCKPFFEFGLVPGRLVNDLEGNIYVTQMQDYRAQKYSPRGSHLLEIGNQTKYYKQLDLGKDFVIPPLADLENSSILLGVAISKKYILFEFENPRVPYKFSWIDIYDLKGNLLVSGIKEPSGFRIVDVGTDGLFYFIYMPVDNISSEVPNSHIIGYEINRAIR